MSVGQFSLLERGSGKPLLPVSPRVVSIFGAGASKAVGGLTLRDLLPKAFSPTNLANWRSCLDAPPCWAQPLQRFLEKIFFVEFDIDGRYVEALPDFGLVLSLLDQVIEDGSGFIGAHRVSTNSFQQSEQNQSISHRELVRVREYFDAMICDVILPKYNDIYVDPQIKVERFALEMFFDYLYKRDSDFGTISLNYDMFVERAACQHLSLLKRSDFGLDRFTARYDVHFEGKYKDWEGSRIVHKLHGSLDWANCPGCGRVYQLFSKNFRKKFIEFQEAKGRKDVTITSLPPLEDFYLNLVKDRQLITPEPSETRIENRCPACGSRLRPTIIAPTALKNFSNPHIRHVWSHADRMLRGAEELYFVGYSLPTDDLAFIAMLKRSTQHISRDRIHVITPDEIALTRYRSIFGRKIITFKKTFAEWLKEEEGNIPTYGEYQNFFGVKAELIAAAKRRRPEG